MTIIAAALVAFYIGYLFGEKIESLRDFGEVKNYLSQAKGKPVINICPYGRYLYINCVDTHVGETIADRTISREELFTDYRTGG